MADQDKDHPLLSRNVELQRFTARSSSMSVALNASAESDDAFISHIGSLHTQRITQMSGPLYANNKPKTVPWLKHGKHQNKSHAVTPEEVGRRDLSNGSNGGRHDHLLKSGPLGSCNDPDCVSCPASYEANKGKSNYQRGSDSVDNKVIYPK